MLDIFNSDAFGMITLTAAVNKVPYKPGRLGELKLFNEAPISTTSLAIEQIEGQLSLIAATARGSAGDIIGDNKRKAISFIAQHLRRNAKVMADEVQGVRAFGTENQNVTIEQKRDEKLAILRAMHEVTWEYHRVGALIGKVLDADGSTELLNLFTAFDVTQQTKDFQLSSATLGIRSKCEEVADLIDEELGGTTYDRVHVFCGGSFYDTLINHAVVQDILKALMSEKLLQDMRVGFTIGPLTFERAKRWKVKNHKGASVEMINTNEAYAFPIGAMTSDGPLFIGRFAPQPFLDTVNRLNPPLVVKAVKDPADQFIELLGVSCPLFLNTRPRTVIKLTKS